MAFAGRILVLFALGLFAVGAAGRPGNVHLLVQQMRLASGEPYRYHLTSSAHERVDGTDVLVQTDFWGLQYVARRCDASLCSGTFFDGTRLFAVNVNDTALPSSLTPERVLRGIRIVNSGEFLSEDFERLGGALSDLGTIRSDGHVYRALGVSARDAQPMVVWVDPQTYLVSAVRDWKGIVSFENRDYRHVGSLMLPFAIYHDGGVVQQYEARAIAAVPFESPHGLIPHFSGDPATIPFVAPNDTPIVPCRIAQITVRCLIDTGNSGLSLSLELAERLHLDPVGEFEVHGLGHYATEVVRTGPLQIQNMEFPAANYIVLHDIHANGYDAVLGSDALANATLTIDYGEHSLRFSDQPDLSSGSMIPLAFMNFVPVVPVELGSTAAVLAVDTGDESTINLSYDYYRQHPDLFSATEARSVSGVGGTSEELIGEIAHVRLGEFRVESLRIGTTRTLNATAQGHLGAGFLSHFRVVFDYARGRIGLTPRAGDRSVQLPLSAHI